MFDDLKDKVVVVTSGVTGIGGAASHAFHSAGSSVYAGSKGFVSAFSKSLAKEFAAEKIRVNCVAPSAFLYLASDKVSGYLTGQVIEVNGGRLMA